MKTLGEFLFDELSKRGFAVDSRKDYDEVANAVAVRALEIAKEEREKTLREFGLRVVAAENVAARREYS